MENEVKYKRWAWGAVIGLAAVIVIAGIVMAMSLTSPEPSKGVSSVETAFDGKDSTKDEEKPKDEETTKESTGNDSTTQDGKTTENKPETTKENPTSTPSTQQGGTESSVTNDNIPKTGPEDAIMPIVALAICGSLFAYNVVLFKKNA